MINNLKINEKTCKRKVKWKLTKKGKKAVAALGLVALLSTLGINHIAGSNDYNGSIAKIVETVKDDTVMDEIAEVTGMNFEEIDQIYATVSTYGTISKNDLAKVENLGINAIKASVMDAYGLDIDGYEDVAVMPSNVGNNSINGNPENELYCVVKIGDQTIKVNHQDGFLKENAVYDLAQDVYLLQTYDLSGANDIVNLDNKEVKHIQGLINTSKEVISNNYKIKEVFFGDELQLKTANRR